MVSPHRARSRTPARRAPHLEPKPLILVLTEGRVTEPEYLRGFLAWRKNPRVWVEIAPAHGVPLTLVGRAVELQAAAARAAKRAKDENLRFEQVWCVFDIDEHPHVASAVQLAQQHGIQLAISNPCFELWLLLHLRESPGARHRHDVHDLLRERLPDYDKHLRFGDFRGGYDDAVRRAAALDADAERMGETGRNPTTGVYRLTEAIR